jgi:hypothetical protein
LQDGKIRPTPLPLPGREGSGMLLLFALYFMIHIVLLHKVINNRERSLFVVPSSWEEGLGVVEKNNDITYFI